MKHQRGSRGEQPVDFDVRQGLGLCDHQVVHSGHCLLLSRVHAETGMRQTARQACDGLVEPMKACVLGENGLMVLASDESGWITGEVIRAAGGLVVAT